MEKSNGVRKPLFRSFSKKDMYIETQKGEKRLGDSIGTDKLFSAVHVPDLNLTDDYNNFSRWDATRKGIFKKDGSSYTFNLPDRNEVCFDFSSTFTRLRDINRQMGYNIDSVVFIKSLGKDGVIEDIINFAFYMRYFNVAGYMIYPKFTLLYKVKVNDDAEFKYFQITQLDLVDRNVDDVSNIESFIRDNFIELSDDGIATTTISKFKSKGYDNFRCLITINKLDVDNLFKITEQILVAKNRLETEGYNIEVFKISNESIEIIVRRVDM